MDQLRAVRFVMISLSSIAFVIETEGKWMLIVRERRSAAIGDGTGAVGNEDSL